MTTAVVPDQVSTSQSPLPRARFGPRYGRTWALLPRALVYLAVSFAFGVLLLELLTSNVLRSGGLGLRLVVAVLLLTFALVASRYIGTVNLQFLRWTRTRPITSPKWSPVTRGKSVRSAFADVLSNGHYWLYALHSLVVQPLLAITAAVVWAAWLAASLVLSILPVWGSMTANSSGEIVHTPSMHLYAHGLAELLVYRLTGQVAAPLTPVVVAALTALGALMIALLPVLTRALMLAHWGCARILLSRFPSEDLRVDVARIDAARTAAIVAEDTSLRRLERDIHDGPQQRLLRLQMELSTAERRLGDNTEAAEAIETARRLASETLTELRALAQGFAPPLLQDRGLAAALGALARHGDLPVETAITLNGDLPDAIERSLYFVAAELVTNAIKHSNGSKIRLEVRSSDNSVVLAVRDDGRGGARTTPGHGLSGNTERISGLGGTLTIDSPEGGPTTVTARIPRP